MHAAQVIEKINLAWLQSLDNVSQASLDVASKPDRRRYTVTCLHHQRYVKQVTESVQKMAVFA